MFNSKISKTVSSSIVNVDGTWTYPEEHCGALSLTVGYESGPDFFVADEENPLSYYVFGSDPTEVSGDDLVLSVTAKLADYDITLITNTISYPVTNPCANVAITEGTVYENDVATDRLIFYRDGGDNELLTFDAFTKDIDYCPLIYTVQLYDSTGTSLITWNRETTGAVHDPAYDAVTDASLIGSEFAKSNEYLTIVRPTGTDRGTITINNTGDLDKYVGSFKLRLVAHHQDQSTTSEMTHTGYECDITLTPSAD